MIATGLKHYKVSTYSGNGMLVWYVTGIGPTEAIAKVIAEGDYNRKFGMTTRDFIATEVNEEGESL